MIIKRFLHFIFVALLFSACKEIEPVVVSKPEAIRITNMSNEGVEAEIDLRIKNPNNTGFNIYRSQIDVKINDISLGKARLTNKVHIKANAEEVYTFKLESDFSKLISGGFVGIMALIQKRSVMLSAQGDINVGKLFYKRTFPINIKEQVPLSN